MVTLARSMCAVAGGCSSECLVVTVAAGLGCVVGGQSDYGTRQETLGNIVCPNGNTRYKYCIPALWCKKGVARHRHCQQGRGMISNEAASPCMICVRASDDTP